MAWNQEKNDSTAHMKEEHKRYGEMIGGAFENRSIQERLAEYGFRGRIANLVNSELITLINKGGSEEADDVDRNLALMANQEFNRRVGSMFSTNVGH